MRTLDARTGDLTTIRVIDGLESLRQRIVQYVRTYRGEVITDADRGIPWVALFRNRGEYHLIGQTLAVLVQDNVRGVKSILSVAFNLTDSRRATLSMTVEAEEAIVAGGGTVTVEVTV